MIALRGLAGAIVLLYLATTGCAAGPPTGERREQWNAAMRAKWDQQLRDGYKRKSNYDVIHEADYYVSVDGYRLWQGTYRGVPIALYSCVLNTQAGAFAPSDTKYLSVILAVEETAIPLKEKYPSYSGPPVPAAVIHAVAEKSYPIAELQHRKADFPEYGGQLRLLKGGDGTVTVEVRDDGEGKLGFQINKLIEPKWDTFDLETALTGRELKGPKTIMPAAVPTYTPDEFADAMVRKLSKFRDPWVPPSSAQMAAIDHPLWSDPEGMKALLGKASEKELIAVLSFMTVKAGKEQDDYVAKLEPITPEILSLGNHTSSGVRERFSWFLREQKYWPRDVTVLEPLLKNADPKVPLGVLYALGRGKHIPSDLSAIRELTKSEDAKLRRKAQSFLGSAEEEQKKQK